LESRSSIPKHCAGGGERTESSEQEQNPRLWTGLSGQTIDGGKPTMKEKVITRRQPLVRVACLAFLVLMCTVLFTAYLGQAEPYIAAREGLKCAFCHVNKTGGGKRTSAFNMISKNFLHYRFDFLEQVDEEAQELTKGPFLERVSIGANFRFANVTTFRDDPDKQGRVQEDQVFRDVDSNDFETLEGVGYLQVDLIKDVLTFYVDESFAPGGTSNREVFGLFAGFLPWNSYIKVGKFFPNYGLTIQDDEAFIRSTTGFNFNNEDEGVEISIAPGGLFLAASVTNGTDTTGDGTQKQYLVNAYYLFHSVPVLRNVMLGGSFAYNDPADRTLGGLYFAANIWRFTVLAEGDLIREESTGSENIDQLAVYSEVNWLLLDWLNLKFAYDYFDPDLDVDENERNRFSLGLEPFLAKNLQLRLFYRVSNDVPERPTGNFAELQAEMHIFF